MIQCDFSYSPAEDGRFVATCKACGRTVRVRTHNVVAACRSVAQDVTPQQLIDASLRSKRVLGRGPGTELKKLLGRIGIRSTPSCSCNARAATIDLNELREPGWCEANIGTIVGWLREEATKRKLPFVDMAGRLLVKRAIRNARKAAS
jgi:hypothetical protein